MSSMLPDYRRHWRLVGPVGIPVRIILSVEEKEPNVLLQLARMSNPIQTVNKENSRKFELSLRL